MYKIDKLKYSSNELEPYLDSKTIEYHRILENRYLERLNNLLIKNRYNFRYSMDELVNHIDIFPIADRGDILYNLGGVLNHELYFKNMNPYQKNVPIGKLKDKINEQYNSYSEFKNIFIEKAMKLVGSGYTFLVVDDKDNLNIVSFPNQETPYSYGYTPIMALDLWEHAYYLKHNINKRKYIDSFFEIVDFPYINSLYENK